MQLVLLAAGKGSRLPNNFRDSPKCMVYINNKTILAERPEIIEINKTLKRGNTEKIKVKGDISKVTLISTGSVTHAQGSESKFRNVDFKRVSNDEIEIVIDKNKNDLQDGNYLLFVLNKNGTPSEGKIFYIN